MTSRMHPIGLDFPAPPVVNIVITSVSQKCTFQSKSKGISGGFSHSQVLGGGGGGNGV